MEQTNSEVGKTPTRYTRNGVKPNYRTSTQTWLSNAKNSWLKTYCGCVGADERKKIVSWWYQYNEVQVKFKSSRIVCWFGVLLSTTIYFFQQSIYMIFDKLCILLLANSTSSPNEYEPGLHKSTHTPKQVASMTLQRSLLSNSVHTKQEFKITVMIRTK